MRLSSFHDCGHGTVFNHSTNSRNKMHSKRVCLFQKYHERRHSRSEPRLHSEQEETIPFLRGPDPARQMNDD